ncbi:hypothetical protein Cp1R7AA1_129 [Mesorhizobium phage Cp1R7A-A1]|nr:hypothetical protein Cp1R7AA1_129 [Mesorhizobium phage Cp1R7A-A1]
MGAPVPFHEQNDNLLPAAGTEGTVHVLPCFRDGEQVISAWRFTPEEIDQIVQTGIVWCQVKGHTQPAVYLTGNYPFVVQNN